MPVWLRELFNRLCRSTGGPRMLYGWRRADGRWLAHTRVDAATQVLLPQRLDIADHVYIGPFNLLDASGGLLIGDFTQFLFFRQFLLDGLHLGIFRAKLGGVLCIAGIST
jgi:hypothetical protein